MLLDVGCGNGTDSIYFARHGFQVVATDFSQSGIEILRHAVPQQGILITAKRHDTTKRFPFRDASFDVIYAHLSLHYFDDVTTRKVFREMRRLLKPKGRFYVKCKSTDDPLYGVGVEVAPDMYRSDHTRHFFSRSYMMSVLDDFSDIAVKNSVSTYHGKTSAFVEAIAVA